MHKSKPTMTTQNTLEDLRGVAKSIGGRLKKSGHAVPHSLLLHALAAALNKRNWHVLKDSVNSPTSAMPKEAQTTSLLAEYSDRQLFWVRLAYLAGTPLENLPARGEDAQKAALALLGPAVDGVLLAMGWAVPATLGYASSVVDAAGFTPKSPFAEGTLKLSYKRGTLEVGCAYDQTKGWYLHSEGVAKAYRQLEDLVPLQALSGPLAQTTKHELGGPEVLAKFHTDDYRFQVVFDARPYLEAASDNRLQAIIEVGFSGDYATDDIATYMVDNDLNTEMAEAFKYLKALQTARLKEPVGFECEVNGEQFLRWMDAHRRETLALLLCERQGVDLSRAQEDEIRGMWDWVSSSGEACEHAFDSKEEAALDAYESLDLLETEISETPEASF